MSQVDTIGVCPFCRRKGKDHSWGPMRDGCNFRFVADNAFEDDHVIIVRRNSVILNAWKANENGYLLALITLESEVHHGGPQQWEVLMSAGNVHAQSGTGVELRLNFVKVQQ